MIFTNPEQKNYIIEQIQNNKVSLFAGAGFSWGLTTKSGNKLGGAKELAKNLFTYIKFLPESKNVKVENLEKISQILLDKFNIKTLKDIYEKECLIIDSTEKYSILEQISFNDIYTTNFDNLFSKVLPSYNFIYREANRVNYSFNSQSNVIYLNGSATKSFFIENESTISNLIISEEDYIKQLKKELYDRLLISLSKDYMIFIGASMYYDKELLQSISKLIDYQQLKGIYIITRDSLDGKTLRNDINTFFSNSNKIQHIIGNTDSFLNWLSTLNFNETNLIESSIIKEQNKYKILNENFWNSIPKINEEDLISFYLSINSSKDFLPKVIKSGFHINPKNCLFQEFEFDNIIDSKQKNEEKEELPDLPFHELLNSLKRNKPTALFINATGGSGKSTFIHHKALELHKNVDFVILDKLVSTKKLDITNNYKENLVFVFDDYSEYIESELDQNKFIIDFINNNSSNLQDKKLLFCFISRVNDVLLIEKISEKTVIEDQIIECKLIQNEDFKLKVINKLKNILNLENEKVRLNKKANITEQIIEFLISKQINLPRISFKFPWEDWDHYILQNSIPKELEILFTLIAVCNYYSYSPTLNTCANFLKLDNIKLHKFINSNLFDNFFQIIDREKIQLINPNLSILFLHKHDKYRTIRRGIIKNLKNNVSTNNLNEDSIHLLRNIYRNDQIKNDLEEEVFTNSTEVINHFRKFIKENPKSKSNTKNLFEIGLCYLIKNKDPEAAIKVFNEHISKFPNERHVKTKLVDTLIKLNKKEEATTEINKLILKHNINGTIFKVLLKFKKKFKSDFTDINYNELLNQEEFNKKLSSSEILFFSKLFIEEGKKSRALILLDSYLKNRPKNYKLNLLKSEIILEENNTLEVKKKNLQFLKSIEFPIYLFTELMNSLRKKGLLKEALLIYEYIEKKEQNIHTNTIIISILRDELRSLINQTRIKKYRPRNKNYLEINTVLFNKYYDKYAKAVEICNQNITIDKYQIQTHFLLHKLHRDFWIFLSGNINSNFKKTLNSDFKKTLKELSLNQLTFLIKKFELNKYICESIYQLIKERRRYRLGIHFLDDNKHIIDENKYLAGVTTFYNFLDDIEKFEEFNNLLKKNSSKRKIGVRRIKSPFIIISQNNSGYILNNSLYDSGNNLLKKNITPFENIDGMKIKLNINRKNIQNEFVFYGKYNLNNNLIINNIEPYFDKKTINLNNNIEIIDILNLK